MFEFTIAEGTLIVSAFKGVQYTEIQNQPHLMSNLLAGVTKPNVVSPSLLQAKLFALTEEDLCILLDAVSEFWNMEGSCVSNTEARLRELGIADDVKLPEIHPPLLKLLKAELTPNDRRDIRYPKNLHSAADNLSDNLGVLIDTDYRFSEAEIGMIQRFRAGLLIWSDEEVYVLLNTIDAFDGVDTTQPTPD